MYKDDLKLLSNQVLEMIQTHVGTSEYIEAYNKVHFNALHIRRERKAQKSILVRLFFVDLIPGCD